ncbi:inactive TPR repeat-containing thioredoxin TTL3-like [Phalaenopsis equestris]|uniref:inactive TPR repeat-containing thioredoxin TTL3-like n=1 Tax=Phalaenopsis equestris TaxID=78828 RepID=UPI0009E1FA9B|nr:inactive TPR repeat-containing thioredoxin TTL3-like [Phalaenopsis equestris]XP_020574540.1 inactive TPR repeat-containing thioredoxin TTL3-like [Phalaenopsis equestris]XP_020574548.1 inactive TPR repeat-containing thioredoxin TTL3-like [Phalaenopsis equestris]
MEDDEKKPSGCCLVLLYNSCFRRHPVPVSPINPIPPPISSNGKIYKSNAQLPIPNQPSAALVSPNHTKSHIAGQSKLTIAAPVSRPQIVSISSELDSLIYDHQRAKGSSTLLRASSGNVMLFGNLGNLRSHGAVAAPNRNLPEYLPKTAKEMKPARRAAEAETPTAIRPALSRRLDAEELKEIGNEEYNKGRYAEAIAIYDRAILIDPDKASYWNNKAAALIGLGRLLDAVEECREAIRIDPYYFRAHQRLANLYIRLGEAERAAKHYKLAKNEASYDDISRAKAVEILIGKCREAKSLRDWNILLKESQSAISAGVDSSPQIFAYQAEAFLMLFKMDDAEESMLDAPEFDTDASTKFFGAPSNAYYLSVRAQVDMAVGKFENAVSQAQMAARIHPGSREITAIARKARSIASARLMGNNLFKACKFVEACLAYGNGLNHDPQNAVLLCNRAACRSKLGQWQKAIEDCNVALNLRPKYSKARLRRADCNAKLEQWEASIEDYNVLVLEMSGDETVSKALQEAKEHLKRQSAACIKVAESGSEALNVTNKD